MRYTLNKKRIKLTIMIAGILLVCIGVFLEMAFPTPEPPLPAPAIIAKYSDTFDVQEAIKAGYSETEIADYLNKTRETPRINWKAVPKNIIENAYTLTGLLLIALCYVPRWLFRIYFQKKEAG